MKFFSENITLKKSGYSDVLKEFGVPSKDEDDLNGNKTLSYSDKGLIFKFKLQSRKLLSSQKFVLDFITVIRPYKSLNQKHIYPGMNKALVYQRMKSVKLHKSTLFEDIWICEDGRKMKFLYNKRGILDTILLY